MQRNFLQKTYRDRAFVPKIGELAKGIGKNENPRRNAWRRFQFPEHQKYFEADKLDPAKWRIVMRINFSSLATWGFGYGLIGCFVGSVYTLYKVKTSLLSMVVDDINYKIQPRFGGGLGYDTSVTEERWLGVALVLCIFICGFVTYRLVKIVHRGYYSPDQNKFILIRPNYLMPWRPLRTSCYAGEACEIPVKFPVVKFLSSNVDINGKKLFVNDKFFFLPAYFDVLCGYLPPHIVHKTPEDADISYKTIVSPNDE